MSAQKARSGLTFEQLYDGYSKTLENACDLYSAGSMLQEKYPHVALGIFEIAEEEVGKSFSCLANFCWSSDPQFWDLLWNSWGKHEKKSARAFFYEWLCPIRAVIAKQDVIQLSGNSARGVPPKEKEAAFYVDFNEQTKKFRLPSEDIPIEEVMNRALSLHFHLEIVLRTKQGLDNGSREQNFRLFSDIPQRLMCISTPQETMDGVYDEFMRRSPDHEAIVVSLREQYSRLWDDCLKAPKEEENPSE
jgi:AbiV family abortive infection protein